MDYQPHKENVSTYVLCLAGNKHSIIYVDE